MCQAVSSKFTLEYQANTARIFVLAASLPNDTLTKHIQTPLNTTKRSTVLNPDIVDPAGKFRKENGKVVFNFGPYRGLPVTDYPEYLDWMLSKSFAPSTLAIAEALLDECDIKQPRDYRHHRWPFDDDDDFDFDDLDDDEFDDDC